MKALSNLLAVGSLAVGCAGGAPSPESPANGTHHELLGNAAPDFSESAIGGATQVSLAHWRGKVVIVDFWAMWCEPCKKAFPKLEELRVKFNVSGLEIVGVSEDDEVRGLSEYAAAYGAKFPLVWDNGKGIANKWHVESMPSTFILDGKGVVRFVHLGYHSGEEREIEREVKSLLGSLVELSPQHERHRIAAAL